MENIDKIHLADADTRAADGTLNLVAGILRQARADYVRGKYKYRKEVARFTQSEWYLTLTNMDNGSAALSYWETLRREELGEGDIAPECGQLFLIEGIYGEIGKNIHVIIVNADCLAEAEKKAHEYGIKSDKHGVYSVIELRGMNEKLKRKIHNDKAKNKKNNCDVVFIKSDVF